MNPFVAYMQYLASVEEDTAAGHANSPASIAPYMHPDKARESDDDAYPCSPLNLPSLSISSDFLDFSTPASESILFQPTTSTVASLSPSSCAPSFQSAVYALADRALSLEPSNSVKEHVCPDVLEEGFTLLTSAREAVALRQSVILTEIGHHLEEIRAKLRIYDGDGEALTAISARIEQMKALAQSHDIVLNFAGLSHQSGSRSGHLSFLQRNGHPISQMLWMLDATKHLRQEAITFVADFVNFPWRHRQTDTSAECLVVA